MKKEYELYKELVDRKFRPGFIGKDKNVYPYGIRRKYIRIPIGVDLPKELKGAYKNYVIDLYKNLNEEQALVRRTNDGYVPIDIKWIVKRFSISERTAKDFIASLKKFRLIEEVVYTDTNKKVYLVNPKYCMNSTFVSAEVMYIFRDSMDLSTLADNGVYNAIKRLNIEDKIRIVKNGR